MPAIENAQSTESVPIGKKYRNLGVEGKKRIWLQQQQQREWEREWEGKREREIVGDSREWERRRKNVFFNLTFKAFKKVSVFFVTFKWKAKRGILKPMGATSFARFQADFLTSTELEGTVVLVQVYFLSSPTSHHGLDTPELLTYSVHQLPVKLCFHQWRILEFYFTSLQTYQRSQGTGLVKRGASRD